MSKKIAVVLRDRQSEGLRMALGLILADDKVDVFWLDSAAETSPESAQNLELMKDMGIGLYSNRREDGGIEYLSSEDLAHRLLEYDHVVPY